MTKTISIIGLRAFPAQFVGSSGLEFYVDQLLRTMLKLDSGVVFSVYSKKNYQLSSDLYSNKRLEIIPLATVKNKVFESLFYAFLASLRACLDNSTVIWYHGIGMGIFSFLPKLFNKEVFVTIHSSDWQRKKWSWLERILFEFVSKLVISTNKVIFVSKGLKKKLKKYTKKESLVAAAGVKLFKGNKSLIKRSNFRYILYIGRITPEKRIEWLLKAFLKYRRDFPDIKLIIAGGTNYSHNYLNFLKSRYLDKSIIWQGYVFKKEKKELILGAELIINPSGLEGLPMVLLESVAYIKNILIARDFIPDDLLNLTNIYYYKRNSYTSFCRQYQKLLSGVAQKKAYSSNELKLIKNYSWDLTAEKCLNFFQKT